MKLQQERLDGFQDRMSEWVAKQGLIFQLRYAGSVRGAKNTTFGTLTRIAVRLLILLVIAVLAFWVYLTKRVDLEVFKDTLKIDIKEAVHAETIQLGGVKKARGFLQISMINVIGDENSCFEDLEVRGVKTPMGLGDGLFTAWAGDSLQVSSLSAFVKGGASTDEEAANAFQSLFWSSDNFKLRTIAVADTNLKWGYSDSNSGQIVGAKMIATRSGSGWTFVFTGGEFSQNWLKGLQIDRIEAEASPDGFQIHEARLKGRGADVSFTLALTKGGASPDFEGAGKFTGLPISDYIDGKYLPLIDGSISGTFSVTGSTNKQSGFSIVSDVVMQEGDRIVLRDRIPLFRAISIADRFRSYKKVRLTTGEFQMTTGGGILKINDLALVASRMMRLEGAFSVRPLEESDIADRLNLKERNSVALLVDESEKKTKEAFSFTLRKAAESAGTKGAKDKASGMSILLNERNGSKVIENMVEGARERELQQVALEGAIRIGVLAAAFERSPTLSARFPVAEDADLRWLDLTWKSASPFAIGEKLAEEIFQMTGEDL